MTMEMQIPSQPEQHSLASRAVMSAPIVPALSPPEVAGLAFQREVSEASLQSLADLIRQGWGKTVQAVIRTGNMLVRIKVGKHGEFAKLFKGYPKADGRVARPAPISQHTAEHLMRIARHPVLSNSTHWVDLPHSWRTLSELARIDPRDLETYLKRGRVHAEITRAEVDVLIIRRQMPTASRHATQACAASLGKMRMAQETLRNLANEINSELTAPLTIGKDGRILSGVLWIGPFIQPITAKPIKAKHRCEECGDVHKDRRTKR